MTLGKELSMKKAETTEEDELRPEYDLRSLKVRKVGPGRRYWYRVPRLGSPLMRSGGS